MCDMTHSYVWCDLFICVTKFIHVCDMTYSYVWHDSFMCVTWLIHTCDMTHSYVWHCSFICVIWLIHTCDMTHSYARHDSFIPPPTPTLSSTPPHTHTLSLSPTHTCDDTTPQESPWSIARDSCARNSLHLWNMTHLCMGRDSFMSVTWLSHVCERCACAWNRLHCVGCEWKWPIHECAMTQ